MPEDCTGCKMEFMAFLVRNVCPWCNTQISDIDKKCPRCNSALSKKYVKYLFRILAAIAIIIFVLYEYKFSHYFNKQNDDCPSSNYHPPFLGIFVIDVIQIGYLYISLKTGILAGSANSTWRRDDENPVGYWLFIMMSLLFLIFGTLYMLGIITKL